MPESVVATVSEPATTITDVLLCSSVRVRVLSGVVGVRKGEMTEMLKDGVYQLIYLFRANWEIGRRRRTYRSFLGLSFCQSVGEFVSCEGAVPSFGFLDCFWNESH